ncbi:MAG: hypothetical protein QOF75_980, partial [Gaiellaceae bacterium]|nr:hypothetical protein [Gaiellaceae bacterium]
MDRPVLHTFVRELVELERLGELVEALPTRARVSEGALPVLLASLHEKLGRPLVCVLPEDADARDAAEAVGWFLGEEQVGFMPSRGVRWESGLEPPPHLVGERARALELLEAGGLVCASALALAELVPPPDVRPATLRIAPGEAPGIDALAQSLALAGYERVDRVEERGHFAVRGGIVDVFPTTGREPLRIELFGDEIEGIRAFSPFTQRALRDVDEALIYPAAERSGDLTDVTLRDDEKPTVPTDIVPILDRPPDLVWQPDDVRKVWEDEGVEPLSFDGVAELDPLPQSQQFSFDAQRPALSARGLSEAENELSGLLRQGLDVIVAFAHRGEAERQRHLVKRVEPAMEGMKGLVFAVAPARRGFVWR